MSNVQYLYDELDMLTADNESLKRENQLLKSQNHDLVRKIQNLEHMLNRQKLSLTGAYGDSNNNLLYPAVYQRSIRQ